MEQAVSRRKKVKIIIAPTYDDSRAKIALWNDPMVKNECLTTPQHKKQIGYWEGRKKMFYLTTETQHIFIYGHMASDVWYRMNEYLMTPQHKKQIGYLGVSKR